MGLAGAKKDALWTNLQLLFSAIDVIAANNSKTGTAAPLLWYHFLLWCECVPVRDSCSSYNDLPSCLSARNNSIIAITEYVQVGSDRKILKNLLIELTHVQNEMKCCHALSEVCV